MEQKLKKSLLILLIVLFVPLSYLKFYTVHLYYKEKSSVEIIKTKKINFINNFYCYDKKENLNFYKYSKDDIIYEDKRGGLFDTTYAYLILIWWGIVLSIIVIIFIKIESKLITINT